MLGQEAASLSAARTARFARVEIALTALDVSPWKLVLLAMVPTALAAWALLSPDRLLSREMTWDLLFNLAGAWHLQFAHVPHVDFHEPVGQLNFLLTEAGFFFFGPTPRAFLTGVVITALAIFVAACFAAWRRLPLLPAAIFVVFACLMVLMPANVGDQPNAYSFAMSYNRYGWSGFTVLALILFLPPHDDRRGRDVADMMIAAVLLVAMFYLKVTYFLASLAALGVAFAVCPQVRRQRAGAQSPCLPRCCSRHRSTGPTWPTFSQRQPPAAYATASPTTSTTSWGTPPNTRLTRQPWRSRCGCGARAPRRCACRSPPGSCSSWAAFCCRRTAKRMDFRRR